jgi:rhamnose transport system permease protein
MTLLSSTKPETAAPDRSFLDGVLRARELGIVLALLVLVAVTAGSNHRFLSGQSIRDVLPSAAQAAMAALDVNAR